MAIAATISTTRPGHGVATMTGSTRPANSEVEIVAAAREGDHEAFRLLVERHQGRVYALALRILRDSERARDASQEAFLKAYRNIHRFEGRAAFGTWMYRLTYNHCLDLKRRERGRTQIDLDDGPWVERAALESAEERGLPTPVSPEEALTRAELRSQIAGAIDQLPEESRQTLLLREVDGLAYAEIAQVLGIPKGTVMSRLHHARKKVRGLLEEIGVNLGAAGSPAEDDSNPPGGLREGAGRSS